MTRPLVPVTEAQKRYAHGTNARYHLGRCRCTPCRKAAHRYATLHRSPWQVRYSRQRARWLVKNATTGEVRHALVSKSLAQRRADALNTQHLQTAPNMYIPADSVREHIARLRAHGVGRKTIARAAGVAYSVIERLATGKITRTRRATAQKVLSVTRAATRGGARVRADDTLTLVGNLIAAGYARGWIATEIGIRNGILHVGKTPWISVRIARAVHALYVRLAKHSSALPATNPVFQYGVAEPTLRRWRKDGAAEVAIAKNDYEHGTTARYGCGCRCRRCTAAHAALNRATPLFRHQRFVVRKDARGWVILDRKGEGTVYHTSDRRSALSVCELFNSDDPQSAPNVLVDASRARRHLQALRDAGINDHALAHAAGVSSATIHSVRSGRSKRAPQRAVNAILALRDVPPSGTILVDAKGTHVMLDRLCAAGFTAKSLAYLLEWTERAVTERRARIRMHRARQVAELYTQLRERIRAVREIEDRSKGPLAATLEQAS